MKILLIAVLFAVVMVSAVNAASIKVVVNDVSPQPVEPGSDLTMRVTFTNGDGDYTDNAMATLDLRKPFTLKTSTENFDKGFNICGFCSRTNTYFISVDAEAKSGVYPIFVRTDSGSQVRTVNVTVRGKPNMILISKNPINATPSNVFFMNLDATNIGTGIARQIKIVSKSSDFVALGSSVIALNSVSSQNFSTISFAMTPSDNLKAGAYNLPFEINYIDESGAQYNSTQTVGVQVLNKGKINIESIKVSSASGQPVAGSPITIIVRLQNIGTGNANSIQSEIKCDGQSASTFLGQLKRDEDAPAVFELTLPSGGKRQCALKTTFSDDSGQQMTVNNFDVTLKAPEFPVGIVVIIIIIGGAYYYFRVRKKKQHR